MDNQNKIDQWAKESLEEREILPSSRVWEHLEKALDESQPKSPKPQKPNLFILGAFIFALFGVVGFWIISGESTHKADSETQVTEVKHQEASIHAGGTGNVAPTPSSSENVEENRETQIIKQEPSASKVNTKGEPFEKVQFIPKQKTSSKINAENKNHADKKEGEEQSEVKIFAQENGTVHPVNVVVETPQQEVAAVTKHTPSPDTKVDAKSLLTEVQKDMAMNRNKYHVDPKELLRVAEKENNETFLHKMLKQVSGTSTSVIAMVNNRNVEP